METKAEHPASFIDRMDVSTILQAYFEFNHLKQLYRRGWLKRGVPREQCESVAEHSFGVAVLAWWLADIYFPELDAGKVLQLALLHDFGEIYAGDIIPGDQVSGDEKQRMEQESIDKVFSKLPGGERYSNLWREFEDGCTTEAKFVRQIDRLEMGLQATIYREQGLQEMDEFMHSAKKAQESPALLALLEELE